MLQSVHGIGERLELAAYLGGKRLWQRLNPDFRRRARAVRQAWAFIGSNSSDRATRIITPSSVGSREAYVLRPDVTAACKALL